MTNSISMSENQIADQFSKALEILKIFNNSKNIEKITKTGEIIHFKKQNGEKNKLSVH